MERADCSTSGLGSADAVDAAQRGCQSLAARVHRDADIGRPLLPDVKWGQLATSSLSAPLYPLSAVGIETSHEVGPVSGPHWMRSADAEQDPSHRRPQHL